MFLQCVIAQTRALPVAAGGRRLLSNDANASAPVTIAEQNGVTLVSSTLVTRGSTQPPTTPPPSDTDNRNNHTPPPSTTAADTTGIIAGAAVAGVLLVGILGFFISQYATPPRVSSLSKDN